MMVFPKGGIKLACHLHSNPRLVGVVRLEFGNKKGKEYASFQE